MIGEHEKIIDRYYKLMKLCNMTLGLSEIKYHI